MSKEENRGGGFPWEVNRDMLRRKAREDRGFTLIEMLIVVAIIAILIAISIPMVNSSLEKSRHATDAANERAAKAAMMIRYMSEDGAMLSPSTVYFYDAQNGTIEDDDEYIALYGKHKRGSDTGDHKDKLIAVVVQNNGEVKIKWVGKGTNPVFGGIDNEGLCSSSESMSH